MNTPVFVAGQAVPVCLGGLFGLKAWLARVGALLALGLLAGCAGLVDKPVRPTLYDFGPGAAPATVAAAPRGAPLLLPDIEAVGALEGSGVLYRLAYADGTQLRAYSLARWSAPPPQLVRQRLREVLSREQPVLNLGEAAALDRAGTGARPRVLRIELEEFSHQFDSATTSAGVLRLRATLLESTPAGERLVGQRSIVQRQSAATADAPGGVRALAACVEGAGAELARWLRETAGTP